MSDQAELLRQAHAAHSEHRFAEADEAFSRADRLGELSADDLVAWQDSTWWLGQADRALELAEVAHQRLVAEGQTTRAAQAAIGLGFLLMLRGDLAAGSGWIQRGRSLLEQSPRRDRPLVRRTPRRGERPARRRPRPRPSTSPGRSVTPPSGLRTPRCSRSH